MEVHVLSRPFRRAVSLFIGGIPLVLLLAGCFGLASKAAVGVETSGCHRVYGVNAVDLPESSRFTCAAINNLTSAMPSKPETYLFTDESPRRLLWKCKFYGPEARRVLLRCEHKERHFSIVKSTNK
jgi:hypothetical protein